MSTKANALLKESFHRTGHYTRRLGRDLFPGVAVLCYHGVRRDDARDRAMPFEELHVRCHELDAHCRLLRSTCNLISLAEWRAAAAGAAKLPPRPVLVTFDDGYRNVLTLALPILERHSTPCVLFVCSGPVERGESFWFDAVARSHGEAAVQQAKTLPYNEWKSLCSRERRSLSDADPLAPLTTDEVRRLADSPLVEIGGHTENHPILAQAESEQQLSEISENKRKLEDWTGRPVRAFAYPNGRPMLDYTTATAALLRPSGFDVAFSTRHGFSHPDEDVYQRSRFFMLAGVSAAELAHRLCYSWRS